MPSQLYSQIEKNTCKGLIESLNIENGKQT